MKPAFANLDRVWAMEPTSFQELFSTVRRALSDGGALQAWAAPAAGAAQRRQQLYEIVNGVAIVSLEGVMSKHPSWLSMMFGGCSTAQVRAAVMAAAHDDMVHSIVLDIDSPGGANRGTDALGEAVWSARAGKRVVACVSDMCASAAYWVASQAHEIVAAPGAFVGSIGVYMVVDDWSGFFAQKGIKSHLVKYGDLKGAGVEGPPVTPEQLAEFERFVTEAGHLFVSRVARGRGVGFKPIEALADGRIHIAARAQTLGLIDRVESLETTLARLRANPTADPAEERATIMAAAPPAAPKATWSGEQQRARTLLLRQRFPQASAACLEKCVEGEFTDDRCLAAIEADRERRAAEPKSDGAVDPPAAARGRDARGYPLRSIWG